MSSFNIHPFPYIFHLFVFFCFLCMSLLLHPQDYKTGFGGQFGVQKDRVDASAAGWDHVEKVAKHPSQQGRISLHVVLVETGRGSHNRISLSILHDLSFVSAFLGYGEN